MPIGSNNQDMDSSPPDCPGCNADLGQHRHCLACDIELLPAPEEAWGWLAHLRGTLRRLILDDTGKVQDLELELVNGRKIQTRIPVGARRHPTDAQIEEGDNVELLATRLLIFEEGGFREAPRQREQLVVCVISSGVDATSLMQIEIEERRTSRRDKKKEKADKDEAEMLWPEGFRVDPWPGKNGWRLRLHIADEQVEHLGGIVLFVICAFFGVWFLFVAHTIRPLLALGLAALLLVMGISRLLRNRVIVLDARRLVVQRGPLSWIRRHVASTEDISAVFTSQDAGGYAVEVLNTNGERAQVLWDLPEGPLPILITRALEITLGISDRATVEGERCPEVSGRLPDLHRLLRPINKPANFDVLEPVNKGMTETILEEAPRRVKCTRGSGRLTLQISNSGVGRWPFYLLTASGVWLLKNSYELSNLDMLWPLNALTLVCMLVSIYAVAAMLINSTRLDLTSGTLQIWHVPCCKGFSELSDLQFGARHAIYIDMKKNFVDHRSPNDRNDLAFLTLLAPLNGYADSDCVLLPVHSPCGCAPCGRVKAEAANKKALRN